MAREGKRKAASLSDKLTALNPGDCQKSSHALM